MMPEGLLKTLKDDAVRDLIAYLRPGVRLIGKACASGDSGALIDSTPHRESAR